MVCGGFSPDTLLPGVMRGLDRRLDPDHPSRSLWWSFNEFDWTAELTARSCTRLLYWGSEDRQMAKRLRRLSEQLMLGDVDFLEFPGFDHGACNTPEALQSPVVPAIAARAAHRLGPAGAAGRRSRRGSAARARDSPKDTFGRLCAAAFGPDERVGAEEFLRQVPRRRQLPRREITRGRLSQERMIAEALVGPSGTDAQSDHAATRLRLSYRQTQC
jgi:hypothetical protein